MPVLVEVRDEETGYWNIEKTFENETEEVLRKFLWWSWKAYEYEPTSNVVIRAVAYAKTIKTLSDVRVKDDLGDEYCVFWENGRWLLSSEYAD